LDQAKRRKTVIGEVTSDKMDKTIVVKVVRLVKHPIFHKMIRQTKKFKAHDYKNECSIGDKVQMIETRPLSKEKRWRVTKILEKIKEN